MPYFEKNSSKAIIHSKSTDTLMYQYKKKEINTLRIETTDMATNLCVLGKKYSTDKSPFNITRHRHPYTSIYDLLFSNLRNENLNFAEIGILDNASIRMFREYFSKASIYGFEFNEDLIKKAKRNKLKKVYYHKINVKNKDNIYKAFKKVNKKFKIIIDDSTHEFNDQINVIEKTINFLAPGGYLIIEDIFHAPKNLEINYMNSIKKYSRHFEKIFFIECNHINKYSPLWNNDKLLVLKKI